MKKFNLSKGSLLAILSLGILFIFLIDLGNPNAPRQGTEGFYLQIFKEMFQRGSFLTPFYGGQHHWSKPPLHFWLAFPYKYLTGSSFLLAGRISTLFQSIFYIVLVSLLTSKLTGLKNYLVFIVHVSTIGFLKYSRIYMMEMNLVYLTYIGLLFYLSFKKDHDLKSLIFSSFFLGTSVLIKGPVSIIMAGGLVFLFEIFEFFSKKIRAFRYSFLLFTLAISLGSIWFLLCYFKYGNEFFNYFFLRENLGKFSSKSYPIRGIIQGLFLFSLPWCLLLPSFFRKIKSIKPKILIKDSFLMFHIMGFLIFFFIWFIPKQRSHHYALPSLPFFLGLILFSVYQKFSPEDSASSLPIRLLGLLLSILNLVIVGLLFYFPNISPTSQHGTFLAASLIFTFSSLLIMAKGKGIFGAGLSWLLSSSALWIFITPSLILPTLPQLAINLIPISSPVAAIYRKPFFLSEVLQKDVLVANPSTVKNISNDPSTIYFLSKSFFESHQKELNLKKLAEWKTWKRGQGFKEIFQAFKLRDFNSLKESYTLSKRLSTGQN